MALRPKQNIFQKNIRKINGIIQEDPKYFLLQSVFIILVAFAGFWNLQASFIAQLEMNRGANMANFSHSMTDPDALAILARKEHLGNANLPTAFSLYQSGLENFILHVPSWLGIAEIYNDQSKKLMGVKALEFIHEYARNSQELAWSKTLLADTLGQEKIMTETLVWLAQNHTGKRRDVFNLAALTWTEPETVMGKFGPDHYMDILEVYIRNNTIGKTWTVWKQMEKDGRNSPENAIRYVNYLLQQNEYQLAKLVWKSSVNTEDQLLFNGSFEQPITGSGLGWRISKPKGVSSRRGDYGSGLEISFDGTENVALRLAQTVPIEPGQYYLTGTYETDSLTTDQRPYWSINGVQCSGLNATGEMVPASVQQTEFIVRFTVPEQCEAIQVSLLRKTSYHFDNKISGGILVNNLRIERSKDQATADRLLPDNSLEATNLNINKLEIGE